MQEFLSSKFGYRVGQFFIALIVLGVLTCSILFSSCNAPRHGIIFNEHTGEAFYYGVPPLDTLRVHFGLEFDYVDIKRVLLFDKEASQWVEVPFFSQLRPIPIGGGNSQEETLCFHVYSFTEGGDVQGVYTTMLSYKRDP